MIAIIILSTTLVLLTLYLHQRAFRFLAGCVPLVACHSPSRIYLLMFGIFVVHLVEILLYAGGFYMASSVFNLGDLEGEQAAGALGHFYASAVFYTSLGLGDVLPIGHLRFMAGIEALNGLLLIAWSASFLFAATGHFRYAFGNIGQDTKRQTEAVKEKNE